ncbi:hypothetical protein [Candidatus Uabimicrobium amorphum]|uniref:Flagellar hook-associated protein FlgL n=1 Tax=Uabimicrobium amorphum TaxID=2596890 RepID=A0A5S9IN60_UABAM|nr:hypothetical protein [Candidatus Uabimicrobium amorphum]BBM84978.1 flagellar hook-associated protein FlgL [Candidatus Uabimicrobium amorphum]
MRVTTNGIHQFQLAAVRQKGVELQQAQEKIALGKNNIRVSDDPNLAKNALRIKQDLRQNDIFTKNIEHITNTQANNETALREVNNVITSSKNLVLFSVSSLGQSDRDTIANDLNEHIEQVAGILNTKKEGRHLFSGTSAQQPFALSRDANGNIDGVTYNGNDEQQQIFIDTNVKVANNIPGSDLLPVLETLINARDVLLNTGGLSEPQIQQQLSDNVVAELDAIFEDNSNRIASVGSLVQRLDETNEKHIENKLQLEVRLAQLEDLDIAEGAIDLNNADTNLRSTFFAVGRGNPSLLDFTS